MGDPLEVVCGSIRAARTPGGNIEIDTTHTLGGLVRSFEGCRPQVVIERADLDDAIEALTAIRDRDRRPRLNLAELRKDPASTGFAYATRRRIERYVRAQVAIPGSKGRVDGFIELGLHFERERERASDLRPRLIEMGEDTARRSWYVNQALDEDRAELITADLDNRIVARWGDRPRFIEIWRGTGDDDAEPLIQVYAPHGMPIGTVP